MSTTETRTVGVDTLEMLRLAVVQLSAILETISAQLTTPVIGDAIGGAVILAEHIADRIDKLTD